MAIETNIGRELSDLIMWLRDNDNSAKSVKAIGQRLGVSEQAPLMMQLIGAVAGRLAEADRLAQSMEESGDIDMEMRDDVQEAVVQLSKVFSPRGLSQTWSTTVQDARVEDAKAFRWFGAAVAKHQTRYKLDQTETEQALQHLTDLSVEVRSSTSLSEWERRSIALGIESLRLMLRYLPWFGLDNAEDAARRTANQVNRALQSVANDDPLKPMLEKGRRLLVVLVAILGAVAAPDAAATALAHYGDFFAGENPWAMKSEATPPKLLGHSPAADAAGSQ